MSFIESQPLSQKPQMTENTIKVVDVRVNFILEAYSIYIWKELNIISNWNTFIFFKTERMESAWTYSARVERRFGEELFDPK